MVLSALEKLTHLVFDFGWVRSVADLLKECLVEIVGHESQRFRVGRRAYLTDKLLSVLILITGLIQKWRVGLQIENPFVSLINSIFGKEASISQVFVSHVFGT